MKVIRGEGQILLGMCSVWVPCSLECLVVCTNLNFFYGWHDANVLHLGDEDVEQDADSEQHADVEPVASPNFYNDYEDVGIGNCFICTASTMYKFHCSGLPFLILVYYWVKLKT